MYQSEVTLRGIRQAIRKSVKRTFIVVQGTSTQGGFTVEKTINFTLLLGFLQELGDVHFKNLIDAYCIQRENTATKRNVCISMGVV